jgi:hypothetical protein
MRLASSGISLNRSVSQMMAKLRRAGFFGPVTWFKNSANSRGSISGAAGLSSPLSHFQKLMSPLSANVGQCQGVY